MSLTQGRAAGPWLPVGLLLVGMVSIQYGATLARSMFPLVGAQGTTGLRLAVASVLMTAVLRPWRGGLPRAALPALLGYGASLGAMNLSFYMALRTVPLGIAVALEFTGPLLVAVLSSRRRLDFLWVLLAAAGLLLLSPLLHTQRAPDPVGTLFALGAGACWALYIVFAQRTGAVLGDRAAALGTVVAAVLVAPVAVAHAGGALLRPPVLLSALAVGLFSSAVPYSLEMMALTRLPARVYSILTSLEPALGALLGLLLLGQVLTGLQWAGIGVVMAAAFGAAGSMEGGAIKPE